MPPLRPTELVGPGPTYDELYAEGAFAQRPFIGARDLRGLAQARGVYLPLFPRGDVLEPLDQAGALSPVAFRQTNYSGERTWLHPDPDELVWREQRDPERWDNHAWQPPWRDDPPVISECYSPWQLLYLADAVEGLDVHVDARSLLDDQRFAREADGLRLQAADRLAHWRELDAAWQPFLKLLVALQPRLWPYRAGRTTLLVDMSSTPPARVDPLEQARETFDARGVLDRFEIDLESLAWLHYHAAGDAQRLDPAPHLYRLLDAAPRKRTDLLRGEALRARDLYDAASLLRGLYYLATDQWLPGPDELDTDGTVEEWQRRHLPRPEQPPPRSRRQLKEVLIAEGVYPHRVHFFVEGQTEEHVLTRLLRFLGYDEQSGMTVTNIHGIDKADRYSVLFSAATEYAARTVIIGDREGEIDRTIRRLRDAGVFTDEADVLLWQVDGVPASFEEANFTYDELLAAITRAACQRTPDARLTLTSEILEEEFDKRVQVAAAGNAQRPALANVALELARDERYGAIRAAKTELAVHLADALEAAVREAGDLAEAGKHRPLLPRLWYWLINTR